MVTILPMPHEVLLPLCDQLGLTAAGMVWGYVAAEKNDLAGFCVVSEPEDEGEPCEILALEGTDKYVADGLLRRALNPFYETGVAEYQFRLPPDMAMLPDYVIIGRGSLAQLFKPHCPQS